MKLHTKITLEAGLLALLMCVTVTVPKDNSGSGLEAALGLGRGPAIHVPALGQPERNTQINMPPGELYQIPDLSQHIQPDRLGLESQRRIIDYVETPESVLAIPDFATNLSPRQIASRLAAYPHLDGALVEISQRNIRPEVLNALLERGVRGVLIHDVEFSLENQRRGVPINLSDYETELLLSRFGPSAYAAVHDANTNNTTWKSLNLAQARWQNSGSSFTDTNTQRIPKRFMFNVGKDSLPINDTTLAKLKEEGIEEIYIAPLRAQRLSQEERMALAAYFGGALFTSSVDPVTGQIREITFKAN